MQEIAERLKTEGLRVSEDLRVTVPASKIKEEARKVRDVGYDHVKSVTGIDYPHDGVFKIIYHVSSYSDRQLSKSILTLEVEISRDNPQIPSLVDIWPSVKYVEAETSELFGIEFQGNSLKKVMLPEDFEGFPLRRDFKIPVEGIEK